MDREVAAQIVADVAIRRNRTDVPSDVVEALRAVLEFIAHEAEDMNALVDDGPEAELVRQRRRDIRESALARWASAAQLDRSGPRARHS